MENVTRVVWIIVIVGLALLIIEERPRIERVADDAHAIVVSMPEWKALFERAVVAAEKFKVGWFSDPQGESVGMGDGKKCFCGCAGGPSGNCDCEMKRQQKRD